MLVTAGNVEYVGEDGVTKGVVNGLFGMKKTVEGAQVITDMRPGNCRTLLRPAVSLPSAEHLTKLAIPIGTKLAAFTQDLSNFYHHLVAPVHVRRIMGLPKVWVEGQWKWPR